MCGIAVAWNWDAAEVAVGAMVQGLLHRGDVSDPVASPAPRIAMGTRRLRIVDGAHGAQPMLSDDGRILVSFNGEIYNHAELRAVLEAQGRSFRTLSDTEVLATALSAWGSAALPRLSGMFAFVALDLSTGRFMAARDPVGVKPLYLVQDGEGLLFCSEIAPLLNASERGDVMLLPPGHLLTPDGLETYPNAFWTPSRDARAAPGVLDALLRQAVHARVPDDLDVALMFSGGIDSTLVAHYARELQPRAPGYFLGDESAPDHAYAKLYADVSGMEMREVSMAAVEDDPDAWIDHVVDAVETFEPGAVRGGVCNYVLSQRMHEDGFKVALCGDGADELFAGYRPHELAYAAGRDVGDAVRNSCLAIMNRDNLQLLDRCSMRFAIEAREPFLDPAVVAYALSCDGSTFVETIDGAPRGKAPLRAMYGLDPARLPAAIGARAKLPFNEGCGMDRSVREGPWVRWAQAAINDLELAEGMREFADYGVTTKEELLYLRKLAARLDIARVPHLKGRVSISIPRFDGDEALAAYNLAS